jgi:hypothetical protein
VQLLRLKAKPRGITSARDTTIARWVYATSTTTLHSTRHDLSTRQDRERGRHCLASERRGAGATRACRRARADLLSSPRPWCSQRGAGRVFWSPLHRQPPAAPPTTSVGTTLASSKTTAQLLQHVALLRCNDSERFLCLPKTASQDLFASPHPAGRCDTIFPPRGGPRRNDASWRLRPERAG